MISYLEGELVAKEPRCIVKVGGMGFEVQIPGRDREKMPGEGSQVGLHTYLYVREDRLVLYGFLERADRELFTRLIEVSGIGPKIALGMLSSQKAGRIAGAIKSGDTDFLSSLPGLGKRTAERLITELRDKLELPAIQEEVPAEERVRSEVVLALTSLGLTRSAAEEALSRVDLAKLPEPTVEEVVREALKLVGGAGP